MDSLQNRFVCVRNNLSVIASDQVTDECPTPTPYVQWSPVGRLIERILAAGHT